MSAEQLSLFALPKRPQRRPEAVRADWHFARMKAEAAEIADAHERDEAHLERVIRGRGVTVIRNREYL